MRPTKPTGPATAMLAPTRSDAAAKLRVCVRPGSTPTEAAASGPAAIALSARPCQRRTAAPRATAGAARVTVAYVVHSRPPIIQRNMRETSENEDVYWTASDAAEQNIDTVTPARMSVAGGSASPTRARRHTIATAAIAPMT